MSYSTVRHPHPGNAKEILFVGSNTEPNVLGLKWFYRECWPDILKAVPDAKLNVVGTVYRAMHGEAVPPSVTYLGLVEDLSALYQGSGIVISPLTFGSGLKIKLIEAMALGKAIVATSVTLQGVEELASSAVCHADASGDFSSAVIKLATNDELRLQKATGALAVADAHFTSRTVHANLIRWFEERFDTPNSCLPEQSSD
nr:glycosyltransferase family 4 protein [Donghicola mangrovi]